ncbi:MAG TPA: aspartyl/asparaginyl beta-hydroxylase domain-containing protein [Steroidobacteraceae bacterium]|nr:aspartyl/asparaginyl beta-hydroxylase domain-containing protein [Steroidobacteraceae bacterium]
MLDLPGHPPLDKLGLIGTCSRLPVQVNAARLQAEVAALPEGSWAGTGGRVGVHRAAQAIFLRGFAPAEGEKPIEDREHLFDMPYVREIIAELIPAPAQRCLLARLPPAARITGHIDLAPYFAKTIRIHVPVVTNADAWMYCGGLAFRMQPGEVWALNNSSTHGVWNAHTTEARTHLICDFLPSPELLGLLMRAERELGAPNAELETMMRGAH